MKSNLRMGVNPNILRQAEDFYATDPKALEIFLAKCKEDNLLINTNIWEPACGQGHLAKVLEKWGHNVTATDLIDRGYGLGGKDFVNDTTLILSDKYDGDILTNPPFNLAEKFVERSMGFLKEGNKLFLFLKIQFLEGQKRKELFKKHPLKYVYCYSARQLCSRDGNFEKYTATTLFFAWYVWEKGFIGEPIIRWI